MTDRTLEQQGCAATPEELCAGALKHYDEVSTKACHWNNQIPQAIKFWYLERPALLRKLAALKNPAPQPSAPANESPEQSRRDSGVEGAAPKAAPQGCPPMPLTASGSQSAPAGAAPIRSWLLTTPDGKDLKLSNEDGWNVELVIGEEQNAAGQYVADGRLLKKALLASSKVVHQAAPDMPEEPSVYSVSFHPNMDYDDVVLKRDYDALRAALVAAREENRKLRDEQEFAKAIVDAKLRDARDEAERREREALEALRNCRPSVAGELGSLLHHGLIGPRYQSLVALLTDIDALIERAKDRT